MKVKAPSLLKKIMAALSNKTNELRIRIMIFFLLHKNIDKTSLTHSLQALVSHHPPRHHNKKKNDDTEGAYFVANRDVQDEETNASLLMYYNQSTPMIDNHHHDDHVEDYVQPSSDLTHALFRESEAEMEEESEAYGGEEVVDGAGEAVGLVEDVGDDDIDQAADLFIQRFKQQIQLQKQLSLERNHNRLLQSNA